MYEITEKQFNALSPLERRALETWLVKDTPPLSPVRAMGMFELFLAGHSCEEIQRLNPQFALGMILHARVRDGWDEKREQHVDDLYKKVRERFLQIQMEGVTFTSDLLAVVHKLHGDKLKRYLQSGQLEDLEGCGLLPRTIKEMRDTWEMMAKMTGQDKGQPPAAPTSVAAPSAKSVAAVVDEKSGDAHEMIKRLLAKRNG